MNKKVKLSKCEVICDKCNGEGQTTKDIVWNNETKQIIHQCVKCWGEGKVDWIENIVGKDHLVSFPWISTTAPSTPNKNGQTFSIEVIKQLQDQISKRVGIPKSYLFYEHFGISMEDSINSFNEMYLRKRWIK